MIHKQFFWPKPGYKGVAYGYGCGPVAGQEDQIRAYYALRSAPPEGPLMGIELKEVITEPPSLRSLRVSLRSRQAGAELIQKIRPGDHLIVASLERLCSDTELIGFDRYLSERGISLHIVNYGGCSLDCSSPTGRLLIGVLVESLAFREALMRDKNAARRARKRARKMYAGGCVPFFCKVENKRLVFRDWALPLMEKIVAWRAEGVGCTQIARMIKSAQLHGHRKCRTIDHVERLEEFYKAWDGSGRPNINEQTIDELIFKYKEKQNGQTDVR